MKDFSVLIGGSAGSGIESSANILAKIFKDLGYFIYTLRDYPSIIRGGHTFSIIRLSSEKKTAFSKQIDYLLALNQETIDLHKDLLKKEGLIFANSSFNFEGIKIPIDSILKEESGKSIMANLAVIGAFCKSINIDFSILEKALKKYIKKEDFELNIKMARRGYDESNEIQKFEVLPTKNFSLLIGNDAICLGLLKAGLQSYIAYPMTPSSSLLHFLAKREKNFDLKVLHLESEIAVIMTALGFSYSGKKVAVGTSGGGFCLMTEGLSFAAMSELPIVIIMGQRGGPSTGLPTYTAQSDLHFVLHAGHGEFFRFLIAPSDAKEAFESAHLALEIAWKYQLPAIVLTDTILADSVFSLEEKEIEITKENSFLTWDEKKEYKRYLLTENCLSPMKFPPTKNATIKINSYEHDEEGITTEDPKMTKLMQEKRLYKETLLKEKLKHYPTVKIYGKKDAKKALLCFGSIAGCCKEVAQNLGLKVIQPLIFSPFIEEHYKKAIEGVEKIISVENNALGELARFISNHGFKVDEKILKYDGRAFSIEELYERVKKVL